MAPELPNKPLVEAFLEIKWVPLSAGVRAGQVVPWRDPYYPLLVGILYESLKKKFPFVEALSAQQIPDELSAGLPKTRFRRSENEWPLVQAGPGMFSLNYTDSYKWEHFQGMAKETYGHLVNAYRAAGAKSLPVLSSATLRYINAVEVPEGEHQSFVSRYLHVQTAVPSSVANARQVEAPPTGIDLRLTWPLSLPKGSASLRIVSGQRLNADAVIFDLSVTSEGLNAPKGARVVGHWLSQAHNLLVETWFLSLIEGELEARFKGE